MKNPPLQMLSCCLLLASVALAQELEVEQDVQLSAQFATVVLLRGETLEAEAEFAVDSAEEVVVQIFTNSASMLGLARVERSGTLGAKTVKGKPRTRRRSKPAHSSPRRAMCAGVQRCPKQDHAPRSKKRPGTAK